MKRWIASVCLVLALAAAGCSPANNADEETGPLPEGNLTPNDLHDENTEIEAIE